MNPYRSSRWDLLVPRGTGPVAFGVLPLSVAVAAGMFAGDERIAVGCGAAALAASSVGWLIVRGMR